MKFNFTTKKQRMAESEYFHRFGYQMCTADFVAFILGELGEGHHDLLFVADEMQAVYSCWKFRGADGVTSTHTVDDLCVAIEKVCRTTYDEADYNEGLLTVRSYGKKEDGSKDNGVYDLRVYVIRKFYIRAMGAEELEGLFGPLIEDGKSYRYNDAWQYEELPRGKQRSIMYNVPDIEDAS